LRKQRFIAAGFLVACVTALTLWLGHGSSSSVRKPPPFSLPGRNGESVRSDSLRGTPVLVHFWASWCPPCLDELPALVEWASDVQGKEPGKAFKLVLVSNDTQWSDADKILTRSKLPSNAVVLLDPSTKVAESFGTYQLPETYWLDSNGQIQNKWIGPQNWKSAEFRQSLESLLK
jgi:cytochrome c biogenesis protein CcmG/thiol:disulfide interchange protein DsbE